MDTTTLSDLLSTARSLVYEPTGSEYERGQLDLIACTFGKEGVPTDERMGELAEELGWPNLYTVDTMGRTIPDAGLSTREILAQRDELAAALRKLIALPSTGTRWAEWIEAETILSKLSQP